MINYGGNLPENYAEKKSSKVAVLPIPYGGTSTFLKGPEALLDVSANIELYKILTYKYISQL